MLNEQLINFIKESLESGFKIAEIRKSLLEKNWIEPEIDEAINFIDSQKKEESDLTIQKNKIEPTKFSNFVKVAWLPILIFLIAVKIWDMTREVGGTYGIIMVAIFLSLVVLIVLWWLISSYFFGDKKEQNKDKNFQKDDSYKNISSLYGFVFIIVIALFLGIFLVVILIALSSI